MELVIELLLEIVVQLGLELGSDSLVDRWLKRLQDRAGRIVVACIVVLAGFGAGYWWGDHVTEAGRTDPPSSLWVSIGLAFAFTLLALARVDRPIAAPARWPDAAAPRFPSLTPWRWSATRLLAFALLNASATAGIAAGFTPMSA
jgi:hypothetical protein